MLLEKLVIPIDLQTGLLLQSIETVIGALGGIVSKTDEWADHLDVVQDSLGGTSKEAAGLALAAKKIGMPIESAVGLINKMVKGLVGANGELGPTGKLLESMGIRVQDANGKIRPFSELMAEVSTKIGNMPDGLDKTNLEMQLFGRAGAEAGDLLSQLANGGMEAVINQADQMGLAIDPAKIKEFDASWATLQATLQGFMIQIGVKIIPVLQTVIDKVIEFANRPEVQAFVDGAIAKFGQLTDWLTNTGIPKLQEFIGQVAKGVDEFKAQSKTEVDAIKIHWEEMLTNVSQLLNDVFGTKGINLIIDWKAIGITALQAIDIMFAVIAKDAEILDKLFRGLKKVWEEFLIDWDNFTAVMKDVQALISLGPLGLAGLELSAVTAPKNEGGAPPFDIDAFITRLAAELAKVMN